MNFVEKVFGTHSDRELKYIYPIIDKIEKMRPTMQAMSDEELKDQTRKFKERLAQGETLDDLLPEAFATVREAAKRVLKMEHYPVQLIGGIVLHQGRIAEMKTGEGKTLVSTCPAYLNALAGKGVQIVTVNDYLAKRDAEWMGQVHEFLGLKVGVVLNSMTSEERKAAYQCDITYVTNNELGFDYLRDNMAIYKEQMVLRDLDYCIIDEVDSVLIDEARTPLIISGQSGKSTKLYEVCDVLAKQLVRGEESGEFNKLNAIMGEEITETGDFIVNEKEKVVNLTEQGVKKVEAFFHIDNLADAENLEIQHNIILALRAHNLMFRDKDYVVKDDEVLIVDEFTGRIMPGRRYSDGLHQAIEAKEHVNVKRESRTLATITFQNFFNKYAKKGGMTGTAQTEEKEFRNIYGMDVIVIPTNRPVIRKDLNDAVYKTKKEKFHAVVEEIVKAHEKGQPVLVGTITIETSEMLSQMLKKRGVPHKVLNAKYHELEAEIVAQAGIHGAVTIATNMAGRGTDIKLDDESKALGGLKIIGTERHESRRIDNQLRGRAGRQGDPGESRFYISLEDDLMRLFGSDKLMSMFNALGVPENEQIEHKMLSSAIEKAQQKIETNNYGIRENLLKYDEVNNEQREVVYAERRQVLDGENMRELIMKMLNDIVEGAVDMSISDEQTPENWGFKELNDLLLPIIPLKPIELTDEISKMSKDEFKHMLKELATKFYESKEAEFPDAEQVREIERVVLLKVIDNKWMSHIDDMDQLREGIGLQAYGNRDPLVEYKMNAYEMFDDMTAAIREDTIRILCHIRVEEKVEREPAAKVTGTNRDDSAARAPQRRQTQKIYPNDPCPCGSGKKYKQCCGRKPLA
ncbi:MAG: preprotein translocase subunit SecA [Clostridium sp.]|uniref:preprotein translocase subunit SecA n=1 Tax=Pilosibacter fragilis TaxID=3078042 RepID=UPI0008204CC6|nr:MULTISPECIES: preprotein translocase subunit SecA [unclassified Clostridium]RGE10149.1 preprotein translocase subunit SecA [Clostridiaceae bacterium TF01-6]SCH49957.1 preprotein translocase subunit SecA [uncultured Clostridium sp.]RHS24388.1 preprotein translocase subunit SecA [Clostridium sp. AF12-28]RHS30214.1 preprotein translocase subunit SecA [Clostridium sp. AF12-19]RHT42678.1 preprotein translocase subunit SecA [Clostridium sp. AM30-24]